MRQDLKQYNICLLPFFFFFFKALPWRYFSEFEEFNIENLNSSQPIGQLLQKVYLFKVTKFRPCSGILVLTLSNNCHLG